VSLVIERRQYFKGLRKFKAPFLSLYFFSLWKELSYSLWINPWIELLHGFGNLVYFCGETKTEGRAFKYLYDLCDPGKNYPHFNLGQNGLENNSNRL
jgi:hypothetical protein